MKKIVTLLVLFFTVFSFFISFSNINNQKEKCYEKEEPIVLFDITYELVIDNTTSIENVIEKQNQYEIAIQEMQEKMIEIESIEDNKEWFLAYKDIISEYEGWIDPPETIFDYYTEDEIMLICRVVETETYQCDFDSKVNVANVVLNRIESGEFGDTVEDVITADSQFAYGRKVINEDTILAVMFAFEFEDTTNGALYFHSNKQTDTFCGKNYIFSDDAVHHFY